jgi:putative membrane protein
MAMHQSPLAVIVKGALAGAAGTAVMSAFMDRAPELMERAGVGGDEPPTPPENPEAIGSPTEELVDRVTEGELGPEERAAAGEAVHWAYGAAWGAYYAVIQSTFRPSPIVHGAFLGGLMTAVATKVVPRLGLAPQPRNREELITNAASHVVYGVATGIVYQVLNLGRRG